MYNFSLPYHESCTQVSVKICPLQAASLSLQLCIWMLLGGINLWGEKHPENMTLPLLCTYALRGCVMTLLLNSLKLKIIDGWIKCFCLLSIESTLSVIDC